MGGLNFKEGIMNYYLFQKKLNNYLKVNYEGDDKKEEEEGYLVNPDWMEDWRNIINYQKIKAQLDGSNIDEKNFDVIKDYFVDK